MSKTIIDDLLRRVDQLETERADQELRITKIINAYSDLLGECQHLKDGIEYRDSVLDRHEYQFALMRKDDGEIKRKLRDLYPSFLDRLKLLFWRESK
jgi:hypothetical protein